MNALDELDILIFLGGGNAGLINSLNTASNFFNSKVTAFMSAAQFASANVTLQLNTRVVLYEALPGGKIAVSEKYAVKAGPTITQEIGSWTPTQGTSCGL